jgi:hypothetical protein
MLRAEVHARALRATLSATRMCVVRGLYELRGQRLNTRMYAAHTPH